MVAISGCDDGSIVASLVAKIQQGREDVAAEEMHQIQHVLGRDRAKMTEGQSPAIPYLDRTWLRQSPEHQAGSAGATLVRYVGMVQDMLDTEYYASQVNGVKTHYRDYYFPAASNGTSVHEELDMAHNLAERQPLLLVPIPYASDNINEVVVGNFERISKTVSAEGQPLTTESKGKREREEPPRDQIESPPVSCKAQRTSDADTPDTAREDDSGSEDTPVASAPGDSGAPSPEWWPAGCMGSHANQCPVLAKLYYDLDESSSNKPRLRLNDVVEVVGMLSMDPMDADFGNQTGVELDDLGDAFLQRAVLPPPSLLPRLHVVSYRTMKLGGASSGRENPPLITNSLSDAMDVDASQVTREDVIQLLSRHVLGDTSARHLVVAEALLMTLLSLAEREEISSGDSTSWAPVKTPSETALGCASLNLVLPDTASCARLRQTLERVLQAVVPITASLELDRETLGKAVVAPGMNEQGRMVESPLQLPQGAALVFNQATLSEGPLSPLEMETLLALACLTKSHFIPYRFDGGMKYTFEADYRVIVLSVSDGRSARDGSKILPCSLSMPVFITEHDTAQIAHLTEAAAAQIRSYLSHCRSPGKNNDTNISFSKELLDRAQQDFVERRVNQRARKNPNEPEIGENDFHRWLTLARLQARSRIGDSKCADVESWTDALRLDDAMRSM